jgi:hypothetical protein
MPCVRARLRWLRARRPPLEWRRRAHKPGLVAHCLSTTDVQTALSAAREHGVPISVRGGRQDWVGRMYEGLASSGYNPGRMPHNIGQGAVQTFERLEVSARLFGKLLITEICTSHFYYHQIVC